MVIKRSNTKKRKQKGGIETEEKVRRLIHFIFSPYQCDGIHGFHGHLNKESCAKAAAKHHYMDPNIQMTNEEYESKICPFGHFIGKILAIWIIIKTLFINKITWLINIIVWIIVFICSLLMNMNSFIYLIPIFVYEILFSARLARP